MRLRRGTAHQARELRAEGLALQDLHLVAEDDARSSTSLGDPLEPGAKARCKEGPWPITSSPRWRHSSWASSLGRSDHWFLGLPGPNSGPKENAAEVRGIG